MIKYFRLFVVFSTLFFGTNLVYGANSNDAATEGSGNNVWGAVTSVINSGTLVNIILAVAAIVLTFIIAKIIKSKLFVYLEKMSFANTDGKEELIGVITRTVNVAVLITGFSVTLGILGVDLSIFMGGIGFGIGFTLKTFLTNFISGIILATQGVYHKGDMIEIGGKQGNIVRINALYTDVEQLDGVVFYVPNIRFLEEEVKNYHTNDRRRITVDVLVDYETDLVKAKAILLKVVQNFPYIFKSPAPDIIVDKLDNSGIVLSLRFWINSNDSYFQAKSNITETVNLAFKKSGIKIPYPQIEITNRGVRTS